MPGIFITGATGAVGQRVLAALSGRPTSAVCLARDASAVPAGADVRAVEGDLTAPDGWRAALRGADAVLHMAAATGAAPPAIHARVNHDGTAAILEAARAAGVNRFVFVSSIAARFSDLRDYPYGRSKRDAEELVRASGLDWTIVRPTQVVGAGSGALAGLSRLVRRGLAVVPGDGRARVQPIDADDLAALLLEIVERPPSERTVELGGPEATTVGDLLVRIHRARFGGDCRVVHLPLGPLLAALRIVERIAGDATPARPGQFAAFREDGAAAESAWLAERKPGLKGIDAMLSDALGRG